MKLAVNANVKAIKTARRISLDEIETKQFKTPHSPFISTGK